MKFFIFKLLSLVLICGTLPAIPTKSPKRIVTLSPALSQIVLDLGLEEKLVCSAEPFKGINFTRKIKSVGFYHRPSLELIIECMPDLVITTYAGTPPYVHEKLKKLGINLMFYKPETIDSIKEFIVNLARRSNTSPDKLLSRFHNLCTNRKKKTGVMLIGLNPIIAVGKGSFVSSAMKCAGVKNMTGGNYPRMSIEKIIESKPDFLILAMKSPVKFKDYKILKKVFKDKLVTVDPETILLPSTNIIEGIQNLKKMVR